MPQLERSSATPVPPPSTSTAIATTSRTKLPPSTATPLSRVGKLRRRIEQDELDGDAWLSLIADAQKKGDLEGARETYNAFFKVYPDAVSYLVPVMSSCLAQADPFDDGGTGPAMDLFRRP